MVMSENKQAVGASTQASPATDKQLVMESDVAIDGKEGDAGRGSSRAKLVSKRDIDDTTLFYNAHKDEVKPFDEEAIERLNRKNFWFLLCQTWWVAFLIHLDKATLSQASIMGIFDDVRMTKNEYNELFVVFYAGYLIALWPGAAIAQRVGHKYFITTSLLLWSLLLGMHPLIKTGKQMIALRFLLGLVRILVAVYPRMSTNVQQLTVVDRVANCALDDGASPGLFPAQKEPLGPATMVVGRLFRQRPPDHGCLQAHQG